MKTFRFLTNMTSHAKKIHHIILFYPRFHFAIATYFLSTNLCTVISIYSTFVSLFTVLCLYRRRQASNIGRKKKQYVPEHADKEFIYLDCNKRYSNYKTSQTGSILPHQVNNCTKNKNVQDSWESVYSN